MCSMSSGIVTQGCMRSSYTESADVSPPSGQASEKSTRECCAEHNEQTVSSDELGPQPSLIPESQPMACLVLTPNAQVERPAAAGAPQGRKLLPAGPLTRGWAARNTRRGRHRPLDQILDEAEGISERIPHDRPFEIRPGRAKRVCPFLSKQGCTQCQRLLYGHVNIFDSEI